MLQGLVDKGNTVIVIEHNLDVIKTADWVIDMGPEGGSGGGMVVAEGTPEDVAVAPGSHTGTFLANVLPDVGRAAAADQRGPRPRRSPKAAAAAPAKKRTATTRTRRAG